MFGQAAVWNECLVKPPACAGTPESLKHPPQGNPTVQSHRLEPGVCVSTVAGPPGLPPTPLRCPQSQQNELGLVVAARGGSARPELDPQRLSQMVQTLLTVLTVFSSVVRMLIPCFRLRAGEILVGSRTVSRTARCLQSRPNGWAPQSIPR